jgi:hypothetical protein
MALFKDCHSDAPYRSYITEVNTLRFAGPGFGMTKETVKPDLGEGYNIKTNPAFKECRVCFLKKIADKIPDNIT